MLFLCALGVYLNGGAELLGSEDVTKVCVFSEGRSKDCESYAVKKQFSELDGYLQEANRSKGIEMVIFGSSTTDNPKVGAGSMDGIAGISIGETSHGKAYLTMEFADKTLDISKVMAPMKLWNVDVLVTGHPAFLELSLSNSVVNKDFNVDRLTTDLVSISRASVTVIEYCQVIDSSITKLTVDSDKIALTNDRLSTRIAKGYSIMRTLEIHCGSLSIALEPGTRAALPFTLNLTQDATIKIDQGWSNLEDSLLTVNQGSYKLNMNCANSAIIESFTYTGTGPVYINDHLLGSTSLSVGVIIGIVGGSILFVGAIVAAVWIICKRRKQSEHKSVDSEGSGSFSRGNLCI